MGRRRAPRPELLPRAVVGVATCLCRRSASAAPAPATATSGHAARAGPEAVAPEVLAVAGSQFNTDSCWQAGYTRELCCRPDATVNCWDAFFTYQKCCVSASTHASSSSSASRPPAPPKGKPQTAKTSVGDKASCWRGGYTHDRCCKVPSIVAALDGCWDEVYTELRCCGEESLGVATAKGSAVGSAESPKRVDGQSVQGTAAVQTGGASIAKDVAAILAKANGGAASPSGPLAPSPPLGPLTPSSQPGAAEASASTSMVHTAAPPMDATLEEARQARFFRREGSRRWATYFRKAHGLLNEVLEATGAASSSSSSSSSSNSGSTDVGKDINAGAEQGSEVDPVQVYHLLYEVVNQVVGGIQLASEASGEASGGIGDGTSKGATLRAAFLSAAVVLARLAQASTGTPLEHEEFGAQAGAAIALSCRQQDDHAFREDLAKRIHWLQREVGTETATTDGVADPTWSAPLLESLLRRLNASTRSLGDGAAPREETDDADMMFQRSWQMYAEDLVEAVWRPAGGPVEDGIPIMGQTTLNPLEEGIARESSGQGNVWQIFSTYVMAKSLSSAFARSSSPGLAGGEADVCPACAELTRIVLDKYYQFEIAMENATSSGNGSESGATRPARGRRRRLRPDEVNNAFFAWQLTHDTEQRERGDRVWPELYGDSKAFAVLKRTAKMACLEYLQRVYDASLSALDLAQLELSIWASVTPPSDDATGSRAAGSSAMGLAFHDHPLALLSGVFYAQAGGHGAEERTPTVFADPRGTTAFRYTRRQAGRKSARMAAAEDPLEPTAPFHRLAYAHASTGLALVFPSWLVHGVPPHAGRSTRVTFAFNLHTQHGTTLSSWAKTSI